MKPITRFVIAAFAATTLIPAAVMAQSQDTTNQGYLVDTRGNAIVTSGFGLCWRDSDWTPARSAEPCDPTNKPVAAVAPAPKPAVIAAAPPAPPAAILRSEPAKPLAQTISFSGDALFAFDKSVLKPEGKTMLDGLVRQLDGATYDTIVATGHTDRFGSNEYNQKLSERRADAVKDYLVSQNVQASRIDAEGKGKTQPITTAGDCRGAKSTKVIACLQPDRRVDVELKGTKTITGSR
jgi:OOP family OmpA-OmpF porin